VERVLTLPNALTLLRLVLAPVFLWLYIRGESELALVAFAVAAATDLLDGLAARALGQYSRLGSYLDPIADKFLAACALFALWARGRLPLWLPLLVVSRDLAIFAGTAVLRRRHRIVPIAPTRIGKYATFSIAAAVVLALVGEFGGVSQAALAPWVAALGLVAAECVVVSWVQYFLHFVRSMRVPAAVPLPEAGE
jgi:cardiolipin synthase